jgi:hypothetical protein
MTSHAQKKFKDYLITGSAMFASGMIDGTLESISYHYENGFKPAVPNANDKFWNPAISWKNKYKNGDPSQGPAHAGSTNILVCTTDAYHLLRTSMRTIDGVTIAYYINKNARDYRFGPLRPSKRELWKKTVIDFLVLTTIRCAGFHLTYNLMFRKQDSSFRL